MKKSKLRFLIAYGPTQEPLDAVRFLTNRSTGVMGRCLIAAAKKRKQDVIAVECPTDARTALDLKAKLEKLVVKADVLIMAAAVADVRPKHVASGKIKKDRLTTIKLVKNPDILASLAKKKKNKIFVGFGIESENLKQNGLKKLRSKKLDLIVIQEVREGNLPFGERSVQALILTPEGDSYRFASASKQELADYIVQQSIARASLC